MSIRISALYIVVVALCIYAWKDWFKSLCGLILLMVVIEHGDMPHTMFGMKGFNPWNILFLVVFLAWLASRRSEGLRWDMPRHVSVLLLMYLAMILVGFLRAVLDRGNTGYRFTYLLTDHVINTVKWVLPGILLFDGCRTRKRIVMAQCSILGLYLGLSALTFWYVSWGEIRTFNITIGYGSITIAMMMAGASWAILGMQSLARRRWHKVMVICGFFLTTYALILTQGRIGYITWVMTGMIFGVVCYRCCLLLVLVGIVVALVAFPGVSERMLTGYGETNIAGETFVDRYEIASGRLQAWPYVIDKIVDSPFIGYGRLAMIRTGLTSYLEENMIASRFGHPHNAYLEILLDNGLIGFLIVVSFFSLVLVQAFHLSKDHSDPLFTATGTITLALVLAFLISNMGSQHFYPREANMGMWLSIFLMFRVSLERKRIHAAVLNDFIARCMPAVVPGSSQPSVGRRIP